MVFLTFKSRLIFLFDILYLVLMGSFRSEASISVGKNALKFNLPKHKPVHARVVCEFQICLKKLFGFVKEN